MILGHDITLEVTELVKKLLKSHMNDRNNVNYQLFCSNILNKDKLGKERLEIYNANNFLNTAYSFYKGNLRGSEVRGIFDCLIGFEFNVFFYKVLKQVGAKDIMPEVPLINKFGKTCVDLSCDIKNDILINYFSLLDKNMNESQLILNKGVASFELKATAKVSNDDITGQLKIAKESNLFNNCYGVILSDTSVSRYVLREIDRIDAKLIVVKNMSKEKIIKNVLNIFGINI